MRQRLQKLISRSGLASRRAAEKLIADGRVTVNGAPAALGQSADASRDEIAVDGEPLPAARERVYIMLNKPSGYLTAMSDGRGRRTVAELTRDAGERVYPAGRLDMDSEGLLIMTNDGGFALRVAHPSYMKQKVYRVRVTGDVRESAELLAKPMEIDGRAITAARVSVLRGGETGGLIEVAINEGRNRQIRKMCLMCGLRVVSLRRVSIGGVALGDLPPGKWRYLTDEEVRMLE